MRHTGLRSRGRMGALVSLSTYRRGSRAALRAAWILGARGVAALRLRPDWSHVHADARTTPYRWMEAEEDLRCPCYYTRNFFLKKVRPVAPHHPPTPPRRHSSFPSVCVASSPRASRHHPARSRSAPFPPSPSHQLGVHVRCDGTPESFDAHHPDLVAALDPDRLADVHADLAAELARRRDHFSRAERRRREVAARYRPLHPDVYVLLERHVDPRWRQLADMAREALAAAESASAKKPSARDVLLARATAAGALRQRPRGVFAFPALSLEFCRALREEVAHFEQSGFEPSRPNTMNTNGLFLYELGAYPRLLDPLVARLVAPVAAALFGGDATTSPGAASLDHHRSFTVSYEVGKEVDLAYHHDDSEVTLNVCLGGDFEGGELLFGGLRDDPEERHLARTPVAHRPGMALLHRGSHCHEAVAVESGERTNLIVWCRSSETRRRTCAMCGGAEKRTRAEAGERTGVRGGEETDEGGIELANGRG